MNSLVLPAEFELRHRFWTASVSLAARAAKGKLFEVRCPSLRLRKRADVYAIDRERRLLFWLCPVWGLTWNIQLNLPDDSILGVLHKDRDKASDKLAWMAMDGLGRHVLTVRPEGSTFDRLRRRLTLFSAQRESIVVGDQVVATFVRKAGLVHEHYHVSLTPEAERTADHRFVLATAVVLTGVFDRLFT